MGAWGPSNLPFRAQVVVLLVLLVWWMDLPSTDTSPYQVVEYFSGVGRIAMLSRYCGFTTAALDIEYGMQYAKEHGKRSPMDINSSAGLVLLACVYLEFLAYVYLLSGVRFPPTVAHVDELIFLEIDFPRTFQTSGGATIGSLSCKCCR